VALDILNNVFCHNLAFEPSQGVLQRLAFLQSNFCHSHHPKSATIISDVLRISPAIWSSRDARVPSLLSIGGQRLGHRDNYHGLCLLLTIRPCRQGGAPPFCDTHRTVLDCANGHQKENQEEINKIEEE
jgi:hypothetical protein